MKHYLTLLWKWIVYNYHWIILVHHPEHIIYMKKPNKAMIWYSIRRGHTWVLHEIDHIPKKIQMVLIYIHPAYVLYFKNPCPEAQMYAIKSGRFLSPYEIVNWSDEAKLLYAALYML